MSEPLATALASLHRAADAAAGGVTAPVSIQIDWIGENPSQSNHAAVTVERVTKTLVFLRGLHRFDGGGSIALTGVFRIAGRD